MVDSVVRLLPSDVTGRVTTNRIVRHPTSIMGRLMRGTISTNTKRVRIGVGSTNHALIRIVSSKGNVSRASTHVTFRQRTASGVSATSSLFSLRAVKFHNRTLTSVITISRMRLHAHLGKTRLKARLMFSNSRLRDIRPSTYARKDVFSIGGLFFGIPTHQGFLGSGRARFQGVVGRFRQVTLIGSRITLSLCRGSARVFGLPRSNLERHVIGMCKGALGRGLLSISTRDSLIAVSNFIKQPSSTGGEKTLRCFFMGKHFVGRPCFRGTIVRTCRRLVPTNRRPGCFVCFALSPTAVSIGVRPAGARVGFRGRRPV